MDTDIESQLRNLPKFQADMLFKDKLKTRITTTTTTQALSSKPVQRPSVWFSARIFIPMLAVLILLIGGLTLAGREQNLLRPALVSAQEIIRKNIANFYQPGTIYHSKTKQYIKGYDKPFVYEMWDDVDSDMFFNLVENPEGAKKQQGLNQEFWWEVDYAEKTVRKDIYVYDGGEGSQSVSQAVDLSQVMNELIEKGVLEAKEGRLDNRDVYVVYDTRETPEKTWDSLTFDKSTFQLLQTENYDAEKNLQERIVYEIQETLARTDENIAKLFKFKSPGDDFAYYNRKFSVTNGYVGDYELEAGVAEPAKQVDLSTGFSFQLPTSWTASISDQSRTHFSGRFYLPGYEANQNYFDIEIYHGALALNPYLKTKESYNKNINGLPTVVDYGTEVFGNSARSYRRARFSINGQELQITLMHKPSGELVKQFEQLVASVKSNEVLSRNWQIVNPAWAAEAIAGFATDLFKTIEVMGEPMPERITSSDQPYKDGFAKLYKFQAFKGQRLTTVAMEDRYTNPNSFIRSELYNEDGGLVLQVDTRIEFEAPYTGSYYLIVRSFNHQEGGFLLKVFDRNQTQNLVYVKYEDGSERLLDPNKSILMGERKTVVVMQFVSPVEINGDVARYYHKSQEFETPYGLIPTTIQVFMKNESYKSKWTTIEDDERNRVPVKFTQISPSKLLIEPEDSGFFPELNQIVIHEGYPEDISKIYEYASPKTASASPEVKLAGTFGGWRLRYFSENP